MRPLDTSPAAHALQREAFRRMTPQQLVAAAIDMSEHVRALAESGIRSRHADYSDDEVRLALIEILLGRESAARVRHQATPT